jgi:hypothetical protein
VGRVGRAHGVTTAILQVSSSEKKFERKLQLAGILRARYPPEVRRECRPVPDILTNRQFKGTVIVFEDW